MLVASRSARFTVTILCTLQNITAAVPKSCALQLPYLNATGIQINTFPPHAQCFGLPEAKRKRDGPSSPIAHTGRSLENRGRL
jgi:hypothetical protein